MKEKEVSQYYLATHGIGHATITRLKRNQPVTTETIDRLCDILSCRIEDVMEYKRKA
jgi:DNA-binding Xre family transcriptional regulator